MTPEEWQRVKPILETALELDSARRPAFLNRACEDESLRREIESLIAAHEQAGPQVLGTKVPHLSQAAPNLRTALTIGTKLGDFEIVSLLGVGGMGEVYRARDHRLQRDVAIKILPSFFPLDPDRLCRFKQEAQAAASLNHPNILSVLEMGAVGGAPYLVLELLEGETLHEQIQRGPLSQRKAIDYAAQIAQGLAAAHHKGIVHRDLKPDNLFVTRDGRVKILDFGLAKLTHPATEQTPGTKPGAVMGTLAYMSPEQVRGKIADHRTDIFAFGAILYEMLSGKRAFESDTAVDTMSAILNQDPPLSRIIADTALGLQLIVHRCLEKTPELRFQSASDLAFALQALFHPSTVETAQVAGENIGRKPKRAAKTLRPLWRWVSVTTLAVVALTESMTWLRSPVPAPRVTETKQITHDGLTKFRFLTDGSRLYLRESNGAGNFVLAQGSASGGETSLMATPFANINIYDISPDHTLLLASGFTGTEPEDPFWILPLPTGAPRRLGGVIAHDGAWSTDGRQLVFVKDTDLFLANADGTDAHKLITAAGLPFAPRFSPDGRRLRFTVTDSTQNSRSIWEVLVDGTNLHPLLSGWHRFPSECCGEWTSDGRYYFFSSGGDIWALREYQSFLHRPQRLPFQLTTGPLAFSDPMPSQDGKQLFVVGQQFRGQLTRYDSRSKQFLPFLSGMSAAELDFTRDGKWVTYVTYPERILWRCRADGSERIQLTYAPVSAMLPRWSPDGSRIVYSSAQAGRAWNMFLISSQGGAAEELLPADYSQVDATWSPDGSQIAFGQLDAAASVLVLDLKTRQVSTVSSPEGVFSPRWSPDGRHLAALSADSTKLMLFDFKTQKWSEWTKEAGTIGFLTWSPDGKYLYYDETSTAHPTFRRVKVGQTRSELLLRLSGLNEYTDSLIGAWTGLAPDGSALFVRDLSAREVYSLSLNLP